MLGYVLAIAVMTGWYYFCQQFGDKQVKCFLVGTAVIMTLFYGLRGHGVGSDTYPYIVMFQQDGAQSFSNLWDYMWEMKSPAYVLSEWLFYRILPYPQLWLIATSAFFFFTFSKFVEKNSMDPYFSYFIFFTIFGLFQMSGVRQSCAMAVLMMAFEQMKKKNLIKYLLLVGLAYLFHKSAIVFLPFYFIGKRKITKLDLPIILIAIVAIYGNRGFLFDYIKSFTSYDYFEQLNHGEPINFSIMIYGATLLALLLCMTLTSRAKRKDMKPYQNENGLQNANNAFQSSARQPVSYALAHRKARKDVELVLYSQYANAMLLASLFMPLVAVNGAVRRIVMYFALFMVLLIPKAFREFIEPNSRKLLNILFGAALIYLLISGVYGSSYSYSLFFVG